MARSSERAADLLCGAVLGLLLVSCAGPGAKGPFLLHPLPPTAEHYALAQGALVYTDPGFTVAVRPWDWRLVEEEFRRTGEKNPFGSEEGETGRFLFFRIRLENLSPQPLVFNPLRASIPREGEAPIVPVENSDLYMLAPEEQDVEALGKVFRRVSFDGAVSLRQGGSREQYLVFPAPEKAKTIILTLDDIWRGGKSYDLRFVFEAFPGKE